MKLNVHVLGHHVGIFEQVGDFKSVMTYVPNAASENLVSLTMPVRTESYPWDDQLHPIFQKNLPEGYLLQVLQEEFGPHIGASPVALLSVIGRNMVGRLQVAPPEAALDEPAKPIEVAELLKGDNPEEAFSQLVREHAKSGVSGVLPKFLDTEQKKQVGLGPHKKASLLTHKHIIKGSSSKLPFATANEHLCMQVAARVVRKCENRTLAGWRCPGGAPVRRRRERKTIQGVRRFLRVTRTSAIRKIRNDMGDDREGGSNLRAGWRSARNLPKADHNPAVDIRAEER